MSRPVPCMMSRMRQYFDISLSPRQFFALPAVTRLNFDKVDL